MLGEGLPDLRDEIPRIVAGIRARLPRKDVLLTPNPARDESSPPQQPKEVFVYADSARSPITKGTPLLVTARCDDPTSWGSIARGLKAEGFDPYGGRSTVGPTQAQSFISRTRAWFVAPEHPNPVMAVERTGRAVLGWIVPKAPGKPLYAHRPVKPSSGRMRRRS